MHFNNDDDYGLHNTINNCYYNLNGQIDKHPVLNPIIPKTDGGQIHLNFVTVL